jgi:hypothetical protein
MQSQSLKGMMVQNYERCFIMEKNMTKYVVFVKTISGKGGEFWEGFSKMSDEPIKGVMIESSWSLFGYWDFAIIFNADSNDNALHFVGEILRAIPGVGETNTSPMNVLKMHKKM